jgi:hypothetical protein
MCRRPDTRIVLSLCAGHHPQDFGQECLCVLVELGAQLMIRSGHRVVATASLFLLWLTTAGGTLAEDQQLPPGALGEVVGVRSEGNDEALAIQQSIEEISDKTSELLAKYRTMLKQIEAIDVYNAQMNSLIASQQNEMDSLVDQVDRVQEVGRSVTPLMLRMIEAIGKFVELDMPFLPKERSERIASLHESMGRADVTTSSKFRQIMEAYQIENEYGRTIEAYRDSLKIDGREITVDFLRFGRIALVYQSLDESEAGVWSQEERAWVPLDSSYRSSLRAGLKIARKQSAPDLVRLPLPAATDARGEG